ncbi:hypothetical protein LINGRAPRIM_LOCUS1671 [Linum grandiflorum]
MALSIRKSLLSLYLRSSPSLTNPSSFFFSTLRATKPKSKSKSKISVFDYLVNQQQFSPDVAAKALSVAAVKNLKNPKNADSIETIVQKVPRVLSSDVDNVGFKPKDMTEIITSDPWILTRSSVNRLAPSIEALKSVVGSIADVTTLLKKSAWFLKLDLNATMLPNVEYVRSLGLSHEKILRFMSSFPRFFLFKPELVKEFARKVEEMGFDRVVSSMSPERWDDKLKLLRELGFSEEDIVFAFKRQPMAFSTSDRKVKEVVEFLVSETHLDISSIVKAPQLLLCSIEHRIKPRLLVIKALQENNLLRGGQPPNMMNIYKMGHVPFSKKYVFPYCDKVKDLLRIAGGS